MTWEKLSEKVVYENHLTIRSDEYRLPDGSTSDFDVIVSKPVAIVFPLTLEGKVVVAKQYRWGPEQEFFDLPGGMIDEGEDPEAAARRELLEETGYEAGSLIPLGTGYVTSASSMQRHHFLALECKKTNGQSLDEHEHIEPLEIPLEEYAKLVDRALLSDAETYFRAMSYLGKKHYG